MTENSNRRRGTLSDDLAERVVSHIRQGLIAAKPNTSGEEVLHLLLEELKRQPARKKAAGTDTLAVALYRWRDLLGMKWAVVTSYANDWLEATEASTVSQRRLEAILKDNRENISNHLVFSFLPRALSEPSIISEIRAITNDPKELTRALKLYQATEELLLLKNGHLLVKR